MKMFGAVLVSGAIAAVGLGGSVSEDAGHIKNDGTKPVRTVVEVINDRNQELQETLKQLD